MVMSQRKATPRSLTFLPTRSGASQSRLQVKRVENAAFYVESFRVDVPEGELFNGLVLAVGDLLVFFQQLEADIVSAAPIRSSPTAARSSTSYEPLGRPESGGPVRAGERPAVEVNDPVRRVVRE